MFASVKALPPSLYIVVLSEKSETGKPGLYPPLVAKTSMDPGVDAAIVSLVMVESIDSRRLEDGVESQTEGLEENEEHKDSVKDPWLDEKL